MSVLKTVTVDNVTYDINDPRLVFGSDITKYLRNDGTWVALNNVQNIGSGSLDTTSQTIVGAINEINSSMLKHVRGSGSKSIAGGYFVGDDDGAGFLLCDIPLKAGELLYFKIQAPNTNCRLAYGRLKSVAEPYLMHQPSASGTSATGTNYKFTYYEYSSSLVQFLMALEDTTIRLAASASSTSTFTYTYFKL